MTKRGLGELAVATMVLLAVALTSCASASKVGVRPEFEQRHVPSIAVVPFYSVGTFSLAGERLEEVIGASEKAAVASLRDNGFEVVGPRAFRQHLAEHDAASAFDEGVLLRSELDNYFEPSAGSDSGLDLEVATVRELYRQGKLPAEALLFGEVVYHTRTHCRVDPTSHSEHAEVLHAASADSGESVPCVVSHFQAKLVHAPTGETMWFNRRLVQTHLDEASPEADKQNLAQTVGRTLGGSAGLAHFRGGEERTAALDEQDEDQ